MHEQLILDLSSLAYTTKSCDKRCKPVRKGPKEEPLTAQQVDGSAATGRQFLTDQRAIYHMSAAMPSPTRTCHRAGLCRVTPAYVTASPWCPAPVHAQSAMLSKQHCMLASLSVGHRYDISSCSKALPGASIDYHSTAMGMDLLNILSHVPTACISATL